VPLPSGVKAKLRQWNWSQAMWTRVRAQQLQREYEKRRERYAERAAEQRLVYEEAAVAKAVRARIANRGYTPATRRVGDVHTFACVPMFGWHEHLLPDLRELGPVTHFDYTALGFDLEELATTDRDAARKREQMLDRVLPALRAAHAIRPVDWVFCYGGGQDTSRPIIDAITQEFGVPTANMSLDDKQGWAGAYIAEGCRTGAVDITASFDLYMTSARVACEWHMVEGGRPIYMPEGFSNATYCPDGSVQDIPVSFIGAAYGFRSSAVEYLRQHHVPIQPFGPGWNTRPVWGAEQVQVINRSVINLGMGGIEYSESLTNVKTRDFEIPGTGGGVYLTSFNPDLALHFNVGAEIACYRNRDEMLELCRHYLARPEEARAMAARARARCLREHRWLHRYLRMLELFGVVDKDSSGPPV
jgi:spore maturation protein CgeB